MKSKDAYFLTQEIFCIFIQFFHNIFFFPNFSLKRQQDRENFPPTGMLPKCPQQLLSLGRQEAGIGNSIQFSLVGIKYCGTQVLVIITGSQRAHLQKIGVGSGAKIPSQALQVNPLQIKCYLTCPSTNYLKTAHIISMLICKWNSVPATTLEFIFKF